RSPPAAARPAVQGTAQPERVYWGDEHVHTGWSADAGIAGATLSPEDAVRFVRGEAVTRKTRQEGKDHGHTASGGAPALHGRFGDEELGRRHEAGRQGGAEGGVRPGRRAGEQEAPEGDD